MNDDVIKRGIQSSEKIILKNSFDNQGTIQVNDLDFIYSTKTEKDSKKHMGVLGLQFFSTSFIYSKEINMMVILKKKGLTSNYIWNLNYTSDDSGFLVIGEHPHNYDEKNYNKENLKQINLHREGAQKTEWNLFFNEIKYGEFDLSGHRRGIFSPQYGVMVGPTIFDNLITKEFFQQFIDKLNDYRRAQLDEYLAQSEKIIAAHEDSIIDAEQKYHEILSRGTLGQDEIRTEIKNLMTEVFKNDWENRKQELSELEVPSGAKTLHNLRMKICDLEIGYAEDYAQWMTDKKAETVKSAEEKRNRARTLRNDEEILTRRLSNQELRYEY